MQGEGKTLTFEDVRKIHLHKTGKLIQCAILVGAMAAQALKKDLDSLARYGENLGLGFQIRDDILDFTGSIKGKQPRKDIENSKSTFATIMGVDKSRKMLFDTIDKALEELKDFGRKADILRELALLIKDGV